MKKIYFRRIFSVVLPANPRPSFVGTHIEGTILNRIFVLITLLLTMMATLDAADASVLSILDQFSALDVPVTGPNEIPAKPSLADISKNASANPVPANLPGKGLAEHPMLYIGEGCNTMFLVKEGKVIWTYSTGAGWEYDDIWLLSNGHILFSRMQYAEEITPQKKVVWHLDAPKGTEIHAVQPIGLDKVLVLQNGIPPKLMIINKSTRTVEVSQELTPPSPLGANSVHGQFRRGRVTATGTYLISWLSLNKVVEYDKDFKPIWTYDILSPWAAVRLKNGNTLITNEKDKLTREVTPKGETVWEHKLSELPPEIPFAGYQSCVRLKNGNTILCGRGNGGKSCQLIEITPDKKVTWALYDWKNLGPATAIQILDEEGTPEKPGDLER